MIKRISTATLLALFMFSLLTAPALALDKKPVHKAPMPVWKHHADARLDDNDGIYPDTKIHDDLVKSDPNYVPATGAYSPAVGPSGLFNGIFAGNTMYDYQHNRGSGTMIQNTSRTAFGKRYVHVTWMCLKSEDLTDNDRQVNYNCYDWNTSAWTLGGDDHGGVQVTPAGDRAGYTYMGITDDGNAVVFKHSTPEGAGDKTNICIFEIPGMGIFSNYALPNRLGAENIWPTGDISRKGGVGLNGDVIHVFADDGNVNPGIATHAYWRYADTGPGYTWRGPFGMDSTNANSHWCFANGDRVIYALAKPIMYSEDDRTHCDLGYYESLTAGADWEASAGPVVSWDAGGAHNTTDFLENEDRTVYNDFHGGFDSEGRLHFVVPMLYRDTDDGTAYVYTEMMHWDEDYPGSNLNANASLPSLVDEVPPGKEGFVGGTAEHWSIIARGLWGAPGFEPGLDGAVGAFCSNQCNTSLAFGDGTTTCDGGAGDESNLDYVYIVYTQFGSDDPLDLTDASANGQQNANVWMSISNDNGFSWAAGKCVTTDDGTVGGTPTRTPDCDVTLGDTCLSEHWSSCAPLVDDHIHVFYVGDLDAGAIPFGAGAWSLNDLMYYPVPCDDYGDCCPMIAPVLGVLITGDPDCEYFSDRTEGGANEVKYEQLDIDNLGNATLTYSIDVVYLPGSGPPNWLSLDGSQHIPLQTIDKGGATDAYEVEMDGSELVNDLWQAEIQVSHDDPSKPDPYVLSIDFFRADSFICGRGVVVTTPMVALEVSNLESFGRENEEGGMFYYEDCSAGCAPDDDSLFNPIFDGSLLIANRTKSQGVTKYVYRDIFTNSTPSNPGYRALEWPKISFDYATIDSVVKANQTTVDSIIGISVRYLFPQEEDPNQSEFVRIMYRIYPRPGGVGQNLVIGAAVDIDCPGSAAGGMGVENVGGYVENYNLVYQHGLDTLRPGGPGTTEFIRETNRYVAGLTAITCEPIQCGWVGCNPNHVYPESGFDDDTLYLIMEQKYGYNIWADSAEDIHTIMAIDEITLAENDMHVYQIGLVSSVAGLEDVAFDDYCHPYDGYVADLIASTAQAWKKAFGWCEPWWWRYGSTVLEGGSGEIGFVANGTHEGGLGSGCCGCSFSYEINPVPAEGTIYFGPQDGCEGSIVFQDLSYPATYTLTLTVEDLCGDQSDVVELWLETTEEPCDCGVWGDLNGDGRINPLDLTLLLQCHEHMSSPCYIIEPPNCPRPAGDINCDGYHTPADIVWYVELVYRHSGMICPDPCSQ